MLVLYLLSYYTVFLTLLGFAYIFSLSWIWIILFDIFLLGILYSIIIVLPLFLRTAMLYLYNCSWFSVIAHSLAGLLGVIVFIYLYIENPPALVIGIGDNEGTISLLTWMWETAPFKTVFVGLPFISLVLGLRFSNILFPIIYKLQND